MYLYQFCTCLLTTQSLAALRNLFRSSSYSHKSTNQHMVAGLMGCFHCISSSLGHGPASVLDLNSDLPSTCGSSVGSKVCPHIIPTTSPLYLHKLAGLWLVAFLFYITTEWARQQESHLPSSVPELSVLGSSVGLAACVLSRYNLQCMNSVCLFFQGFAAG